MGKNGPACLKTARQAAVAPMPDYRSIMRRTQGAPPMKILLATLAALGLCTSAWAQQPARNFPAPIDGDFAIKNFRFDTGETLPSLNLHYRTIGTPRRDASGVVRNAVMILHGTGGTGAAFLSATFGGLLFGPGQVLDATRDYIILPDG